MRSVRFTSPTDMRWNPTLACPPVAYDVIRGDVASLATAGDEIDLGSVTCVEADSPDTTSGDGETPPPGVTWFYLVRSTQYGDYGRSSDGRLRYPSGEDCR